MAVQKSIVLSLLLLSFAYAHSWIACTDYRITSKDQTVTYDANQCKGYGRDWKDCCENTAIGVDRGFNYQPGNSGKLCRNPLTSPYDSSYSSASPMAKYSPGQEVCLAWAPKNHVAASCINKDIPDNGMEVYMSGPNPTADPTSFSQMTKVADWGKNPGADAYKGFQNCPNFCSQPDKATCTGCFYIPKNVQVGATYTFIWTWEFNGLSDQYSSCWEATIVSSTAGTALSLPSGYYNIAPSVDGNTPPPPPVVRTSSPVAKTSSPVAKTSSPIPIAKTSSPIGQDTDQETAQETEDTDQSPKTIPEGTAVTKGNQTIIYMFAGANSVFVQAHVVLLAVVMAVILAQ
jgi:hypothetical protein